jgi:hypothetical protein
LGVSQYLNLRIDQNRIVRNADTNLEPRGDAPDPDLDIVDVREGEAEHRHRRLRLTGRLSSVRAVP